MNALRRVCLLLLPVLLAGCSSLLSVQRAPFTTYSPVYAAKASPGPHVDWQLMVETPLASDTLDTARMLVMPTPGVIEVFPAARWRDPAPALLRSLVVQGFEGSGRIVGVGSAASGLHADLALAMDLRDFQLEVGSGGPHAAVRFQARLLDYATNRVLATRAFAAIPKAMLAKLPDPGPTIETVVGLADRARREGLLALEDAARDIDDPFLRSGLQAAIDGTDPDDLRTILEDRVATKRAADRVNAKYFTDMGGYAPTVGIIGTVVSLVHVLENLADPSSLGQSIAAAFVATLWGILSANLIWLPFGSRIMRVSDLECARMELTVEGLLAVQAGANPRLVGERLRSLVPAEEPKAEKKVA